MDFLEALKSLQKAECEGIRRKSWGDGWGSPRIITFKNGWLHDTKDKDHHLELHHQCLLADDWILVNPRPQTEEVTETWYRHRNGYTMAPSVGQCPDDWTECKVTYSRPVKKKVKKREEYTLPEIMNGVWDKKSKWFREWEE